MGLTEYLSFVFYGYADAVCYATGILMLAVLIMMVYNGGLRKPQKEDIFPFVKKILKYFQERRK